MFTYADIDLDVIKITSSVCDLTGRATVAGGLLRVLALSDASFNGANLTFTVTKSAIGDGLAAVGRINAGSNNLGTVTIKSDLGDIDAGSNSFKVPAIKTLSVLSMGHYGLDTQGGFGDQRCDIHGALGALKVTGDLKDAFIHVYGGANAKIGSVTIGGSVIGGAANFSGEISSSGHMGAVKIGHDVKGAGGLYSASILSGGKIASITIGGSLLGGSGNNAAQIGSFGDMGSVNIAGHLQGDLGLHSGQIDSQGKLTSVTLGGSLLGGNADFTGFITSLGDMGTVVIGGDIKGADVGAISLNGTAYLTGHRIASVTVGGSIIAGQDNQVLTSNTYSATIRAVKDIGSLTVRGSLIGTVGTGGDITNVIITNVIITAGGQPTPTPATDLAIGKITIGGRAERAQILAGYNVVGLTANNSNAQLGAVRVGGDWIASDLIAGVADDGAPGFGDVGDIPDPGATGIARIASITIGEQVVGSTTGGDRFGFESHHIGSFKAGGVIIPIVSPFTLSALTGSDVTIRLV